jgi:hypothetical protein
VTKRVDAKPGAAAAIATDPAPTVALHRKPIGPQAMAGDARPYDNQAAGLAAARADQRRVAVAHGDGLEEARDGREKPGARRRHVETGRADREDDIARLFRLDPGYAGAVSP